VSLVQGTPLRFTELAETRLPIGITVSARFQ